MAEPTFDRVLFGRSLLARRLGHPLFVRAEVESTNDEAWDLALQGADDGACVIADRQTRSRGRMGRTWHTAPHHGLALSVLLHAGCDVERPGGEAAGIATAPLVAGLALARGLEALGLSADLKWPNDLLVSRRKISGILAEGRRNADDMLVVVLGVGVNVSQQRDDFPPELRESATSLLLEGRRSSREAVAAAFLNALEPLWDEHQEGDRDQVLSEWRARASFWGRRVVVRTPSGSIEGVARDLDPVGGLVVETAAGLRVARAGDVEILASGEGSGPPPG